MSTKYLLRVSLAMIVVSIIGLAVFYKLRGNTPKLHWNWPQSESISGPERDEAAQRVLVDELRAKITPSVRFLAGSKDVERYERETSPSAPHSSGGLDRFYYEKSSTRSLFEGARFTASVVIVLFWATLGVGLLGLLRLRVRHMVGIGLGLYTFAILGGGALLIFTGATALAGIMLSIMLLGFFGQLVGANLLPGADHPFVLAAEAELRALPPPRRKLHIAKRLVGGLLLFVFGSVMTAISVAIHAGVVVVATGAIAGGLFMMTTPLIATIRMRMQR